MQPHGAEQGEPEAFSLPDAALASRVAAYLRSIVVSDHNPAVLFSWDAAALEEFARAANAVDDDAPAWLSQPKGTISPEGIANDMVGYLAQLGGGRFEAVVLAPNSLIQYGHLQERLQYMQYDDFLQSCMRRVAPGGFLARTFVLTESDMTRAVRTRCLPPAPPARPLFE